MKKYNKLTFALILIFLIIIANYILWFGKSNQYYWDASNHCSNICSGHNHSTRFEEEGKYLNCYCDEDVKRVKRVKT